MSLGHTSEFFLKIVDKGYVFVLYLNIPYGIINYSQTDFKCKRNGMLEFIRSVYRTFVLISFWVFLILFGISGGVIGKALSGYRSNYTVGGVIIGLIVGFILDILIHGYIATILNIDENLEIIRQNAPQGRSSYLSLGNKEKKLCPQCKKEVDGDYTGCPHCGYSFSGNNSSVSYSSVVPQMVSLSKKKCTKCKREVDNDSSKCPHCGNDTFE